MKLDILVFAAHPDDAELSCSGTIAKHISQGKKVGIIDLTRGERGTRGSADLRDLESAASAKILGLDVRENLRMDDCFFTNDYDHQLKIIHIIRKYQPSIIIANAMDDRHPDHGRAAQLVKDSVFFAALRKIETKDNGEIQANWKPDLLLHFIQDRYIKPDVIIDISDFIDIKMASIKAFTSQFHDADSDEPETYISRPEFFEALHGRHAEFGKLIQARYAEGFTSDNILGVHSLFDLI